jgi:hypothetical protein
VCVCSGDRPSISNTKAPLSRTNTSRPPDTHPPILFAGEGDLIRAHSRFHRRLVKPTESKIDRGVGMREPDGLAKASDMRMEHQFLRAPVSEGKGFNRCAMCPPIIHGPKNV